MTGALVGPSWRSAERPLEGWDEENRRLGAAFFGDTSFAIWEGWPSGLEPLYVRLEQDGECVAQALILEARPRLWPFSVLCRRAVLGCLPAVRDADPDRVLAVMASLHRALLARGVCIVEVRSYDSPESANVLGRLGYALEPRTEFYLDLTSPTETLWSGVSNKQRNKIRKAIKLGVTCVSETSLEAIERLQAFQAESLARHGRVFRTSTERAHACQAILEAGRGRLLTSYVDGRPVAAACFATSGGRAYSLSAGSTAEGNRCAAPAHALWTFCGTAGLSQSWLLYCTTRPATHRRTPLD